MKKSHSKNKKLFNANAAARPATATAHEYRLNFFQATRRPVEKDEIIQTSWGKIRIKGKLGQAHADVLESIFFCAESKRTFKSRKIILIVDPARVRKTARQEQGKTLNDLVFDLVNATVEIYEPKHLAGTGNLISFVDKSSDLTRPNPLSQIKDKEKTRTAKRQMWEVEIGPIIKRLWEADILTRRDPRPISALRHGISQAVARLVITHKEQPSGGWHLDTLIRHVYGDHTISEQKLWDRRRELRQDAKGLAGASIIIEDGRIIKKSNLEHKQGKV